MASPSSLTDTIGLDAAYKNAQKIYAEGGVPIGAALVRNSDGTVLGQGHNARVQKGSAILHGETAALEDAGRLKAGAYRDCTMVSARTCA